jgi:hypothetical protein
MKNNEKEIEIKRKCNCCQIKKELDQFALDKSRKDGYAYKCKECINEWYTNLYYKKEENKNKIVSKTKEKYYNTNYWKIRATTHKQYYVDYNNRMWKNNINYKIAKNYRNRLNWSIKNKTNSSLDMLGCSIEEFKLYLEQQLKPEMNWENHGIVWEIDHIKACANFDLEDIDQQNECFHYTNHQPLFKTTEIAAQHGYQNEIGNRNKNKY